MAMQQEVVHVEVHDASDSVSKIWGLYLDCITMLKTSSHANAQCAAACADVQGERKSLAHGSTASILQHETEKERGADVHVASSSHPVII